MKIKEFILNRKFMKLKAEIVNVMTGQSIETTLTPDLIIRKFGIYLTIEDISKLQKGEYITLSYRNHIKTNLIPIK